MGFWSDCGVICSSNPGQEHEGFIYAQRVTTEFIDGLTRYYGEAGGRSLGRLPKKIMRGRWRNMFV
jgi:hypothetical protein